MPEREGSINAAEVGSMPEDASARVQAAGDRSENPWRKANLEYDRDSRAHERRRLESEIEELRWNLERKAMEYRASRELESRLETAREQNRVLGLRYESLQGEAEAERARLEARIADLEQQLLDWIDRSNNTHRDAPARERRMEVDLAAHKRTVEIEAERKFRSAEIKWKKTERMLHAEIERLKMRLEAPPLRKPSLIERVFGY